MIPLARRFSAVTAALLALAAVPVWLHRATGAVRDLCADPSALAHLPAFGSKPVVSLDAPAEGGHFDLLIKGDLAPMPGGGFPLHFWLLRDAMPYRFFGRPDNYFLNLPLPEDRTDTHEVPAGLDVLISHRRYDESTEATRFSQFALVQGAAPIRHPLTGGLALALPQLFHGTQPIAMFLIQGVVQPTDVPALEARADAWLAQAWTEYREACRL